MRYWPFYFCLSDDRQELGSFCQIFMYHFYKLSKLYALNEVLPKDQKFTLVNGCYKQIGLVLGRCDLQSCKLPSYVDFNCDEAEIFKECTSRVKFRPTRMKVDKANQISFTTKHALGISSYILLVQLLLSNVYFLIGTPFGKTLISLSAGSKLYRGKQKTSKIVMNEMIKKLVIKSRALKDTGVFLMVLKGVRRQRSSIILRLKDIYPIRALYVLNLKSHNGCRVKKKRRI